MLEATPVTNPIVTGQTVPVNNQISIMTFNSHTEEEITLNMSEGFLHSFHRPLHALSSKQEELRNNQQILLEKIKIRKCQI